MVLYKGSFNIEGSRPLIKADLVVSGYTDTENPAKALASFIQSGGVLVLDLTLANGREPQDRAYNVADIAGIDRTGWLIQDNKWHFTGRLRVIQPTLEGLQEKFEPFTELVLLGSFLRSNLQITKLFSGIRPMVVNRQTMKGLATSNVIR